MSKECKHEWHAINPFQRICCVCNAVTNVVALKKVSQKEFKEMYPPVDDKVSDEGHK